MKVFGCHFELRIHTVGITESYEVSKVRTKSKSLCVGGFGKILPTRLLQLRQCILNVGAKRAFEKDVDPGRLHFRLLELS